jgi:hypothetical protein
MSNHIAVIMSAARAGLRPALVVVATVAIGASCDNPSGPRTGKLSLTVVGLPTGTSAQVTLTGPSNFSRVVTASEVISGLKPGDYTLKSVSVLNGTTRYTPLPDSQAITVVKSETPVDASVAYVLSSGILAVSVAGSPSAATPAVRITGPNGFNRTISAATTFDGVDPGFYTIVAPELTADQQRYAASRTSQQVQVFASLNPTNVAIQYAQITGNLTVSVSGLPDGVTGVVSVAGPTASYVVGASSDLVGVRSGLYTVTASTVVAGSTTYIPSAGSQSITVTPGATLTVVVAYSSNSGPLNLTVDGLTLTQVVQTYAGTVPLIAGRDAYIRVFARANQANEAAPQVRVRFYAGETLVHTMMLSKASGVPLLPDQASLASSWNGTVVGQFVQPGLSIVADVDPTNTVVEATESDNSFPASGTPAAVTVRQVSPLRVSFVPVVQRFDKALVGNVTEANKDQFLIDVRRMLPVLDIDAQVHAPYTTADSAELTSNDGNNEWLRLLAEMNMLRIAESSVRHYFGVVKVSYNSGVAGYGYVPGRAALGWDYLPSGRNVAAHELTHNFGRFHAPCGGVGGPDPSFPYAGGTIGVYGYDLSANVLKLPSSADLMGYCNSPWISDYNYVGAMDWRASNSAGDVTSATLGLRQDATPRQSLLVWGRVERGQLVLEPAFSLVTRPSLPVEGGAYRIEGIARNGRSLFSYSFAGEQPADAPDATARHFAFAIPMDAATQSELASIRLSGGGSAAATMQASLAPDGISAAVSSVQATSAVVGTVDVRWSAQGARMAMIRDRRTGEVLSFARGGNARLRTRSADLEVIVSDGVRSAVRQVSVGGR